MAAQETGSKSRLYQGLLGLRGAYRGLQKLGIWALKGAQYGVMRLNMSYDSNKLECGFGVTLCWLSFFSRLWGWRTVILQLSGFCCIGDYRDPPLCKLNGKYNSWFKQIPVSACSGCSFSWCWMRVCCIPASLRCSPGIQGIPVSSSRPPSCSLSNLECLTSAEKGCSARNSGTLGGHGILESLFCRMLTTPELPHTGLPSWTELWEDPQNRTRNSGLWYPPGVDCRALKWIHLLDPPRALGTLYLGTMGPLHVGDSFQTIFSWLWGS